MHQVPQGGAATHILAIGVGRYPHLVGGTGPRLPDHQGLGQLTSPPISARAVADWFIANFNNPGRPLSTVRLLLSEDSPQPFMNSKTGLVIPVPSATIDTIADAFKAWKADGDTYPDNLMIFYFCGHGIANGAFTALLAEDFGKDTANALDGAIDFYRNRLGMNRCKAKQQLYLIDACRTTTDMTVYAEDYAGRVFVQPQTKSAGNLRPVLYSTLFGQQAYGRVGKMSYFAEALLAALSGAGGDESQGDWRVRTSSLHLAIEANLTRKANAGIATAQISPADDLITFDVHYMLAPPQVPVIVSCRPLAALAAANLRCLLGGALLQERVPANEAWEISLPVGSYDFEATFPGGQYQPGRRLGQYVYPPERNVPVEVAP